MSIRLWSKSIGAGPSFALRADSLEFYVISGLDIWETHSTQQTQHKVLAHKCN